MITVLNTPHELALTKNQNGYQLNSDAQPSIAMRLWIEDELYSDNFQLKFETIHPVDLNGNAEFFIDDVLDAELQYQAPSLLASNGTLLSKVCKRYYAEFAEVAPTDGLFIINDLRNLSIENSEVNFSSYLESNNVYKIIINDYDNTFQSIGLKKDSGQVVSIPKASFTEVGNGKFEFTVDTLTNVYVAAILNPGNSLTAQQNPYVYATQTTNFALLAGIEFSEYPVRSTPLPNGRKVMDRANSLRYVTDFQHSFLYILVDSTQTLSLDFTINYEDGTAHNYSKSYGDVRKFEPMAIPIGFPQENYNSHFASKEIYDIEIRIGSTLLTRLQKIRHPEDFETEIHFANALGGFSSFVASGEIKESLVTSDIQHRKYLPFNYSISDEEYSTEVLNQTRTYTLSIGHQERQVDYEALLDLISIKYAYLKVGTRLVKIEIINSEVPVKASRNFLPTFDLQFRLSHNVIALTSL